MTGRFLAEQDRPAFASRSATTSPDGPERLVEDAVSTFGGLDTFVNHVGPVRPHTGGFHSGSDDYSLATPRIDFLATVRTCARR